MSHEITQGEREREEPAVDPRRCAHVREDGSRCKGWKVKGADLCAGHLQGFGRGGADPRAAASKSAEVRRAAAEARSEARKRSLEDVLAARLEERAEQLIDRLMEIAENGGDADALRAIDRMLDRVYGTAVQRTRDETVQVPEEVEAIRAMSSEERRAVLIEMNRRQARAS